jgi:hypothetical protein
VAKNVKIPEVLRQLEAFLCRDEFVAGPDPTIADFQLFFDSMNMFYVPFKIDQYPNIKNWIATCKTLPGFKEVHERWTLFMKDFGPRIMQAAGTELKMQFKDHAKASSKVTSVAPDLARDMRDSENMPPLVKKQSSITPEMVLERHRSSQEDKYTSKALKK